VSGPRPTPTFRPGTRPGARRGVALVAGLALGAALSACSFGGSHAAGSYTGTPVPAGSARSGQQAAATPGASASAGSSAAGRSSAAATQKPDVGSVSKAHCSPQRFVTTAALAGGAIRTYITMPLTASSPSTASRARAATAATYAAKQLGTGMRSVSGCPTAKALAGVSRQNVTALTRLSSALRAGTVDTQKVGAVDALFADVTAQASRLKLTITPRTPAVSALTRP
jgi:hypothetical protein